MKSVARVALFALPFALLFLGIRLLGRGEAERWRERVEKECPGAVVGVDEEDLIVIAGDREQARAAAAEVRDFRRALVARYKDLLGEPRFERMVVVVFPDVARVEAYAEKSARADRGVGGKLQGYADPVYGAVFVPLDSVHTLRHETVHWVMETARGPSAPTYSPWLSEGLAQLFQTFDPLDPRPPGLPRVSLPAGGIDVDRLVGIEDYGEFVGREVYRNYAEALVLSAFLLETRPGELREYVDAERASAERRPVAFRKILRSDEEPFRRELAAFVSRLAR